MNLVINQKKPDTYLLIRGQRKSMLLDMGQRLGNMTSKDIIFDPHREGRMNGRQDVTF